MKACLALVIFLLLSLGAPGFSAVSPFVDEVSPTPNTTRAELEGPANLTFNCDAYSTNADGETTRVTTSWSYRLPSNPGALIIIDPMIHNEFEIDGMMRNGSGPFPTFRNRLTIVNMTSRLDGGRLFCGHSLRTELEMWTLRLYRPPMLRDGVLVKVVEHDRNILVDIKSDPEAFPRPTSYQWRKQGEVVTSSPEVMYSSTSVLFNSPQRSDSGLYTLTATNYRLDNERMVIGNDTGSFSLDVLYGPEITEEGSSYSVLEGDTVNLVCGRSLSSNPMANITWFDTSGSTVGDNDRYAQSDGPDEVSLQLSATRANDSGVWRCELTVCGSGAVVSREGMLVPRDGSEIGNISISIYLTVVVPPSEPRLVEVREEDVSTTNVTLSWREPEFLGQPGVAAYQIVADDHTTSPLKYTSTNNETSQTISGLLPGTVYYLTVQALAVSGEVSVLSAPSVAINVTTLFTVPSLVCDSALSSEGVITVRWSFTHTGGSPITSLNVSYYSMKGSTLEPGPERVLSNARRMYSVNGLATGFEYTFSVSAGNTIGESSARCEAVNHLIGVPGEPKQPIVERVTNEAVDIRLESLSPGVNSGEQYYYDVKYSIEPDGEVLAKEIPAMSQGVTVERIAGLVQNSLYQFRARTRNRFGESAFVKSELFNLTGTVPTDTPTSIAAVVGGAVGGILVLIVLIAVVIVLLLLCRRQEGGSYKVYNKKARNSYLSPNELTRIDSTAGVKIEEVPGHKGMELEASKELHYAELDTLTRPSVSQRIVTPTSPEERVQYATIDSFKKVPEPSLGEPFQPNNEIV